MRTLPKRIRTDRQLPPPEPRTMRLACDTAELRQLNPIQLGNVITHLASLLMLAAGSAVRESDNDKR